MHDTGYHMIETNFTRALLESTDWRYGVQSCHTQQGFDRAGGLLLENFIVVNIRMPGKEMNEPNILVLTWMY